MNKDNKKIIVATGGTGGHVFPAVSLTNYLDSIGFDLTLTTDKRGHKFIDSKFIKNTKIINSYSFNKKKFFTSIFNILFSIISSFIFLFKAKPKFIFGIGKEETAQFVALKVISLVG